MNINSVILIVVTGLGLFILPLFVGVPLFAVALYLVARRKKQ